MQKKNITRDSVLKQGTIVDGRNTRRPTGSSRTHPGRLSTADAPGQRPGSVIPQAVMDEMEKLARGVDEDGFDEFFGIAPDSPVYNDENAPALTPPILPGLVAKAFHDASMAAFFASEAAARAEDAIRNYDSAVDKIAQIRRGYDAIYHPMLNTVIEAASAELHAMRAAVNNRGTK